MCRAAAWASSRASGAGSRAASSATTYSAKPPCGRAGVASTRRPSAVSPQISTPGVKGSGGRTWYWPRQSSASGKLMFAARTAISTWPSPGVGRSACSSSITSLGSPFRCTRHACMRGLHNTVGITTAPAHTKRSLAHLGTPRPVPATPRSRALRLGPDVHPLPLGPEQAEEFDRLVTHGTEPVREPRVELGGLTGPQDQVVLGELEPEPAAEYVEPLVPLVGALLGDFGTGGLLHHLVRLEASRPGGERQGGPRTVHDGLRPDPRVAHRRRPDEVVERHLMSPGDGQQELQTGTPTAGFEPGQGGHGDPRGLGERRECHTPVLAQPPQTWADPGQHGVESGVVLVLFLHAVHCRISNPVCQSDSRRPGAGKRLACAPEARGRRARQRGKTSKATAGRPPKRSAAAPVVPARNVRQYASGSSSVSTSM